MLAHILYGGTVVLGDIAVGAHILKQIIHGRLGQVDAVAGLHISALGVAGGGILEYLGTVEELPALFLAHLHQGFVVLIHLALGQVLVGVHLPQRRDGIDDDVHAGIGIHDGLDALLVGFHEAVRRIAGAQVVGAEGQDHPLGLHHRHRLGHRHIAGGSLHLYTGKVGQRPGAHAHRTDGVVVAAVVKHPVHPGGVAVAQEKGFVHVGLPGVVALFQDGGGVFRLVDGVLVLVIAALGHQGFAVGRIAVGLRPHPVQSAHQQK